MAARRWAGAAVVVVPLLAGAPVRGDVVPAIGEQVVNAAALGDQVGPQIVAAPDGRALAVWLGPGLGPAPWNETAIFARWLDTTGRPAGAERTLRVIDHTAAELSGLPAVEAAVEGGFLLTWIERDQTVYANTNGFLHRLFSQRLDGDALPVGPPHLIQELRDFGRLAVALAARRGGGYTLVFVHGGTLQSRPTTVSAMPLDAAGRAAGAAVVLSPFPLFLESPPNVASLADGTSVVAWAGWSGDTGSGVVAVLRLIAADGAPAEVVELSPTPALDRRAVRVTPAAGGFAAIWLERPDHQSSMRLMARSFAASGLPRGDAFVAAADRPIGLGGADLAADAAGNLIAVWGELTTTGQGTVFGRDFDELGVPVGPVVALSQHTADGGTARLARRTGGSFAAVWVSGERWVCGEPPCPGVDGLDGSGLSVSARELRLQTGGGGVAIPTLSPWGALLLALLIGAAAAWQLRLG